MKHSALQFFFRSTHFQCTKKRLNDEHKSNYLCVPKTYDSVPTIFKYFLIIKAEKYKKNKIAWGWISECEHFYVNIIVCYVGRTCLANNFEMEKDLKHTTHITLFIPLTI